MCLTIFLYAVLSIYWTLHFIYILLWQNILYSHVEDDEGHVEDVGFD